MSCLLLLRLQSSFVLTYLVISLFLGQTMVLYITWLQNFKEPEGQLARWLEKLQEFDFEVVHRRGRKHKNADALSCLPCSQCKRDSHNAEPKAVLAISFSPDQSVEELSQLLMDDPTIGPVLQAMTTGRRPDKDELKQFSLHTNWLFALGTSWFCRIQSFTVISLVLMASRITFSFNYCL